MRVRCGVDILVVSESTLPYSEPLMSTEYIRINIPPIVSSEMCNAGYIYFPERSNEASTEFSELIYHFCTRFPAYAPSVAW
jgi:hypothetical protein